MTMRTRHLIGVSALAAFTAAGTLAAVATGARTAAPASVELPGVFSVKTWQATSDNLTTASGRLVLGGKPVSGALMRVDRYTLDTPTGKDGRFSYPLDITMPGRHVVVVGNVDDAKVDGKALSQEQRDALLEGVKGTLDVTYGLGDVKSTKQKDGTILVTGRASYADGKTAPPPVTIYTYRLSGTITDATGQPVAGAVVSTRTLDRGFWTLSQPSDQSGRYTSLFTASAEQPGNPVPFDIRVAQGESIYEFPAGEHVTFQRLQSATMDVQLPPTGYAIAIPVAHSYKGAVYEGVVVGVAVGNKVIDPVSATWLTKDGRFSLVLPASAAGKTVSLWERRSRVFLTQEARPGAAIEKDVWPVKVPVDGVPNVATLKLAK